MDIRNKTILLTGATGGMGSAIAQKLASEGARLLLAGRRQERLEVLLHALPGQLHRTIVVDLESQEERSQLINVCKKEAIDILINNAGICQFSLLESTSEQSLKAILATNVEAPAHLCQALLPVLKNKPEAAIVNIGSVFGAIGYPGYSMYCASKFALRGFTEALRRELSDTAIRVHLLSPRATETDINSQAVNALNQTLGISVDSPDFVANELLSLLLSQRSQQKTLGWPEKLFSRINGALPGLVDGSLKKQLPIIRKYALLNQQKS
ncbi:SDR family oxidoreductase [Endozoicomonas numazuensis]|uniref:Short-chain dehydrogenase n=1 Tax=Endozoicomonas numazuensis TaxID=1137799 RepID=A0A081NJ87_9GAMM|nr:SDR family oxidoreductase [Endozoicomonas numazuensis]KEQ18510.1 short-chain dehydrogenase [Endozoicomonas numazuensis]